jgi:hypothetical protein
MHSWWLTSWISKSKSVQSFEGTHRSKMYVCVFIRVNTHMCINIYIYTIFLKYLCLYYVSKKEYTWLNREFSLDVSHEERWTRTMVVWLEDVELALSLVGPARWTRESYGFVRLHIYTVRWQCDTGDCGATSKRWNYCFLSCIEYLNQSFFIVLRIYLTTPSAWRLPSRHACKRPS